VKRPTAADLVRASFDLFNAGDDESLRRLYADDAYEIDMATGERSEGAESVVAALVGFRDALPDIKATVNHLHHAGDVVVAEANFSGTHTAPMQWGSETLAPTQRPLSLDVVQVIETGAGKIRSIRIYYDTDAIARQLLR
jgi:steroid delta-isomerase-like uncharacterized protein